MEDENDSESDQPQRRQRRIETQTRLKLPRDEAVSKGAATSSFPTRDEEKPTASLKTGEQGAAASREQERGEAQNESHEIRRADRARRTSSPRRSNGDSGSEQDDAAPDSPLESSPPRESDPGSVSPGGPGQQALPTGGDRQSTEPEEVSNSHGNCGTRWISQQDLEKLIPQGIRLFQSEATDAIFYLDKGERVWLVDKNGDCVIAQTKNADSTLES